MAGVRIHLKCENLQRGGSFKVRGALTKAKSLDDAARARGLVAHSSGNHAQGVALAARMVGTEVVVVMPEDAIAAKVAATRGYGAEVIFAGRTSEERQAVAERLRVERDLVPVPPFDDPFTIAGQGTVAVEILDELPRPAAVLAPIGGGGLIAGTALAVKALSPSTRVIGVEPSAAARVTASLAAGERTMIETAETVADGLRPRSVGEHNWCVIERFVDEVVTVSDAAILAAMRLVLERTKLVVEPSGAVTVAAALEHGQRLGDPLVAILSGGNLDWATWAQVQGR